MDRGHSARIDIDVLPSHGAHVNTWQIDITLDPPKIRPQQREYLIACELANAGIPINVFNWQVSHGKLTVMEELDGTRHYTWIGEDRRQ